jgi:L-ribulokinase
MWPLENIAAESGTVNGEITAKLADEVFGRMLRELENAASSIPPGSGGITALDWINGRRTPFADQRLKCAIAGMNMGSDAPAIFRSLVEATAFGAKKIVDRFEDEGIKINEIIALGGVAKKSEFVMQIVADILGLEIKVVESEQACALGAAMFAAVAAGIYSSVGDAQKAMNSGFCRTYIPDMNRHKQYAVFYKKYTELGDYMEKSISADSYK